jgi:hypothetical protein
LKKNNDYRELAMKYQSLDSEYEFIYETYLESNSDEHYNVINFLRTKSSERNLALISHNVCVACLDEFLWLIKANGLSDSIRIFVSNEGQYNYLEGFNDMYGLNIQSAIIESDYYNTNILFLLNKSGIQIPLIFHHGDTNNLISFIKEI